MYPLATTTPHTTVHVYVVIMVLIDILARSHTQVLGISKQIVCPSPWPYGIETDCIPIPGPMVRPPCVDIDQPCAARIAAMQNERYSMVAQCPICIGEAAHTATAILGVLR